MKNPLRYQTTKYDCGPASLENAITYLFKREEIPPAILKSIAIYCLDRYNAKGEYPKGGTSSMAMKYLSDWLNRYRAVYKFPIRCEFITGREVRFDGKSKLISCLKRGGVAVLRVWLGCGHYVLLTGFDERHAFVFDPYFRKKPFANREILMIGDRPMCMNRKVPFSVLNAEGKSPYEMGAVEGRDATLLYNLNTIRAGDPDNLP